MALYQFSPDDAVRFLSEQRIQFRRQGNELRAKTCPYCRGGKSGKDLNTFSINLTNGAFNCLRASCNVKGNMITLARDFGFSLGNTVDGYYGNSKKYRDLSKVSKRDTRPEAIRYMESRGIGEYTARRYELTTQKKADNILVFPFRDEKGTLHFVKYRKMDFDREKDSCKEWCEKDCRPILFGIPQCKPEENKTLIMTEGQIDSLSLAEAGIDNAVSVPTGKNGFTWIPYCWDFLKKFDTLIVFGDYERGEISLLTEMTKRFDGMVKHIRHEDYRDCKDANEILQKYGSQALRDAVANAVPVQDPRIKCLAEIEKQDLSQLERIPSGINALDGILGGMYMGQLVLMTGERGQGKSTFASQIGTIAMEKGYPVFFYSGELMDWMVRDWIDRQVAGGAHINTRTYASGYREHHVNAIVAEKISKWYEGRGYLYDNRIVDNAEQETDELCKTMETAIKQYGCRVLIIDNLMTALEDDTKSDLYRQQSNFTKQLAIIAKQFNVLILLIAHPRKTSGKDFANDDVAGSSNITNLVDVVLRYAKPGTSGDESNSNDRILTVHKNRLTGRLTHKDGIRLYFDEASKRISEFPDRFDWRLSWEDEEFTELELDEDIGYELPF